MKKVTIVLLVLLFGIICLASGFFYANNLVKKNQSIGEAKKAAYEAKFFAEYETKFFDGSNKVIANTYLSLMIIQGTSATWSLAIEQGQIFDIEIRKYLDKVKESLYKMEDVNKEIVDKMQDLKNYPIQYQEVYNTLMELYGIYSQLYSLAQSPSGTLISFNNKVNDLQSEFTKISSKLKVYMPKAREGHSQENIVSDEKGKEVKSRPVSLQEFLPKFIDILITFYKANDAYVYGFNQTMMPHERQYHPDKFFISPDIYTAKEWFQDARDKLEKLECSDKTATEIKEAYLKSVNKFLEAIELVLDGLKVASYYSPPNWNKVGEGISKIKARVEEHWKVNEKLYTFIEKNNPSLKDKLPANLLFVLKYYVESRNKDEDSPKIGFSYATASDKVVVLETYKDSPARKYGLLAGDVIIGIKDGRKIQTLKDFNDFMHSCKVGDIVPFLIMRKGEEKVIKIKLGKSSS